MTYSLGGCGICKSDAILDLDAKVDRLDDLPLHEKSTIYRHAREVVAALDDPSYGEQIVIMCHGYIVRTPERTTSVSCAISAFIMVTK